MSKTISRTPKNIIIGLFISLILLAPALGILNSIKQYGVNVPNQDQWELVPLIIKQSEGKLGFNDFWSQHNEHRILVPRVFMLANASVSHWNVKREMATGWLFAVFGFLIMLALLYAQPKLRQQPWLLLGLAIFCSTSMFSYNQAENWIWGWQMQWFMANFFVLLAILLLTNSRYGKPTSRLALAILAATLATYSLGTGQYIWFAGAFLVYITRQKLRYWLVAAAAILASYYYHFNFLDGEGLHGLIKHPAISAKYFFAYLGNPLTNYRHNSIIVGFVGFVLFGLLLGAYLYQANRKDWRKHLRPSLVFIAVPLSLSGYAIFSGFITTMSRARLGVDQALASRYVAAAMFFWIGLLLLLALTYASQTKKIQDALKAYLGAVLAVMITLTIIRSINGVTYFKALSADRLYSQQCSSQSLQPPEDCIKKVYFPGSKALGERLNYVKAHHLAGY